MAEIVLNSLFLVLLLPFWIFLIIMVGRFFSVYVNKIVIYILTLASSFLGGILTVGALWKLPSDAVLETTCPFIKINNFVLNCGLYADRTALIFALVLFIVSFLVQLYCISFMKEEKKTYRFFALLNLFNFSMSGLLFSPNLFQSYFFWEIIGVISYLLIGFEYFKREKSLASQKVFIINRVGDTAMLAGIILCSYFIYSYAGNYNLTSLSFVDMNIISTLVYAYTSTPLFLLICGLFIIACFAKSAQFPFYTWLQDAMQAKLPVSALLHSSTMVVAGVYLILRLMPFLTLEQVLLKVLAIGGLITALLCSFSACSQTNSKKTLAYSTSAQLGLMFFSIGMLNIKAAIAFFVAHAFIKSMLFLTLPRENEQWQWVNFILFMVAGLSLSGLIFSGMITKELIVEGLGLKSTIIFSIISFLTAFYITRIALIIYSKNGVSPKFPSIIELGVNLSLLLLNILFYFYIRTHSEYTIAEPFWAALTAWVCVYVLFIKDLFWKVPIFYQLSFNGFYLDKIYMALIVNFYRFISDFANYIDTKILGNYSAIINLTKFSVRSFDWVENNIMNNMVRLVTETSKRLSIFDLKVQNGSVQRYNAYAFCLIVLIFMFLILIYTYMIRFIGG